MNNHLPETTVGEEGYLALLQHILQNGYESSRERTGTGTIVNPSPAQLHFPDVGKDFPLITTKYVSFNMLACEMLWFISGSTNANGLEDIGSHAMMRQWLKWAEDDGELGPVYGKQWRKWAKLEYNNIGEFLGTRYIDQLKTVIANISENPESRRHIVTAWNPADLDDMALPPCHLMYQFTCEPIHDYTRMDMLEQEVAVDGKARSMEGWEKMLDDNNIPKYKLHLHLTQRSADMFLGVPFNIAEYALLLMMVSKVTNTVPGDFTWTGVNCHIYENHKNAVKEQLSRDPKSSPIVKLDDDRTDIDSFSRENIHLAGYNHHPKIEAEVSV